MMFSSIYQKLAELLIQRVGSELHRTGNDDLGRDGVEDFLVPVYYQAGNLSDNLSLEELFTHVNLGQNSPVTFTTEGGWIMDISVSLGAKVHFYTLATITMVVLNGEKKQ